MRVCCLTGKLGQKTKFDPQDVFVCQREVHQKNPELNNRGGFSERSDFEHPVKI